MKDQEDNILSLQDIKFVKDMIEELKDLKKEQQNAILWVMYHYDFLDLIDSGKIMTGEEEEEWIKRAKKDNDCILMALIQYKKQKDQDRA